MPAPTTVKEFVDLIEKSGVADAAKIDAYVCKLLETNDCPRKPDQLANLMVREGMLTYFQAEQLLQGKYKRFFIGKYKVLERIGTGGMGQVFLCEHKLMRRRVALKVLPAAKAQDPASLERFYREARAVAALDHPNIVRAYDIDQDENIHFLVMEFVDGPNLQDLVKKNGPLDPVRACHYVFGAAVGLQHANEMGLVHRDIKPGNILVDRTGTVKVLDMGLARFFHDEDDMLTKKYDENVLGTADYLAPEQAVDSHKVDIRADIYSLGGTFYFMLTGQAPFPDGTIAQKLLWHQTRDPKPVRSLRPEIPQELAEIVETMMKKNPLDRYQIPAELMAALAPWVQNPIAPPPEQELPQLSTAAIGSSINRAASAAKSSVIGCLPALPGGSGAMPGRASGAFQFSLTGSGAPLVTGSRSALPVATVTTNVAEGWAKLASDTQPSAMNDTSRHAAPVLLHAPASARRRFRKALIAGVLVGLLAAAATGYVAFAKPFGTAAVAEKATHSLYVKRDGDGPDAQRTYPTLRAALSAAKPGSTILILDDTLDEPAIPVVTAKSAEGFQNIVIRAENSSKSVRWSVLSSSSQSTPQTSALELQNAAGVRIEGLTIDCQHMSEFGISLTGSCPGLTLSRVTILNPRSTGLRLSNLSGDAQQPVRIESCRIASDKPLLAGILVLGQAVSPCRFLTLTGNRLDGAGTDAIRFVGPLHDIEFQDNRIANWTNGVTWAGGWNDDSQCKVTIRGNTFFDLQTAALRCDTPMPRNAKMDVQVRQNLFVKCAELAHGPGQAIAGLKAVDNARDPDTRDSIAMSLTAAPVPAPEWGTDPANDSTYLKYRNCDLLTQFGNAKVTVGVPAR